MARKHPEKRPEKPAYEVLAGTNDGRDITRGFVDALDYLAPQDDILRERGGGDYKAYEALLDDDQVFPAMQQRQLGVIAREWRVDAASDDPRDIEAADWLRGQIAALRWDEISRQMLLAVHYGFAVAECLWAEVDGRIAIQDIRVRSQRRFRFAPDGALLLITTANRSGEHIPDRKFWVLSLGADHADEPYGRGVAHHLFWPVFFKRNALRFWMAFLDKFGTPTTLIEAPAGTSEVDCDRLLEVARAVHRDTGVVVPQGVLIRYLESARAAGGDFGAFIDRMDATISKVVLGQTMTTDDGSSLAQSRTHLSVRDQLLKADADLLCESFNRGPATWLTEWNFPGARPPRVWRAFEASEDLMARAQRDATIAQLGFRPTLESIVETYGGDWEPMLSAAPQMAVGMDASPEFAEPDPEGAEEAAENRLADQLDASTEMLLDRLSVEVRDVIATSKDLDEVRDRLYALAPGDTVDEMAAIIQDALTVAELMGRAEVSGEVVGGVR